LLGDAVDSGEWDIALLGAEPQRAEKILFTAPYVQISATYLVRSGSPLTTAAEVDAPGVSIVVTRGNAYELWLSANLKHATLVRTENFAAALEAFASGDHDALAGLRTDLVQAAVTVPGSSVLVDDFTAVQQAVGASRTVGAAGAAFLAEFVEEAKTSGLVGELIERFGVADRLSVSPLANSAEV
jgi:polar amino acid transport system substrate-binding protein